MMCDDKTKYVHATMCCNLDAREDYGPLIEFYMRHLSTLAVLETQGGRFYNAWIGSYMYASQWTPVPRVMAGPTVDRPAACTNPISQITSNVSSHIKDPAYQALQRMRRLWAYIDNHGCMPTTEVISFPTQRLSELSSGPLPVFPRKELVETVTGSGSLPSEVEGLISMPPGLESIAIPDGRSQVVGPVVKVPQVKGDSIASKLSATVHRTTVALDPTTGKKIEKKLDCPTAHREKKFWQLMNDKVFTRARIKETCTRLFEGKALEEFKMSSFSAEDNQRVVDQLEMISCGSNGPSRLNKREANSKLEIVTKPEKAVRWVINNTHQLMALNYKACCVVQELLIGHGGVFESLSIKHHPRTDVLEGIVKDFAKSVGYDTVCAEVDQTGMENHERCDNEFNGTLSYMLRLLESVSRTLAADSTVDFPDLYSMKISYDVKHGLIFSVRFKDEFNVGRHTFKIKFGDMYLDSGWILTSCINFINELIATLSAHVSNPEHILAWNGETKRFRVEEGSFDFVFDSIPLYVCPEATETAVMKVYNKWRIEGDDGAGRVSAVYHDPRNVKLVEANYLDLGYSAKYKTILNGRLEFIGAHMAVENGITSMSMGFCPDIKRYICKAGCRAAASRDNAATAARFYALSTMFAGNIDALRRFFARLGDEAYSVCTDLEMGKFQNYDEYSEVGRMYGGDTCQSLVNVRDKAEILGALGVSQVKPWSDQVRMVNVSVFENADGAFTAHDMGNLEMLADSGHSDSESVYAILPACLR